MNPAQMILHAQLAVRPDRADHPHSGQPSHGVASRRQMWHNMPAAGNPASATELLPPDIGEPPAPATSAGRPVARRAGRDRQPAQDTGPAGLSAGAAMLPDESRRRTRTCVGGWDGLLGGRLAGLPFRDAGAHGRALTAVASSEHDDGAPSRFAPQLLAGYRRTSWPALTFNGEGDCGGRRWHVCGTVRGGA